MILGPFVGALIAELIHQHGNTQKVFKAAMGAFAVFVLDIGLKLFCASVFIWNFVVDFFFG